MIDSPSCLHVLGPRYKIKVILRWAHFQTILRASPSATFFPLASTFIAPPPWRLCSHLPNTLCLRWGNKPFSELKEVFISQLVFGEAHEKDVQCLQFLHSTVMQGGIGSAKSDLTVKPTLEYVEASNYYRWVWLIPEPVGSADSCLDELAPKCSCLLFDSNFMFFLFFILLLCGIHFACGSSLWLLNFKIDPTHWVICMLVTEMHG